MGEHWYVYAIAPGDAALPAEVPGVGGPLRLLVSGDLGAVVSCTDTADAGGSMPAPNAENLLEHERVVEALRSCGPALPVRFGTILPSSEAVVRALDQQCDALRGDLQRIGDKLEMGISALWVRVEASREVPIQPDPPRPDVADGRPGLAYLRRRQAQYQRADAVRRQAEELARDLDAALRRYAVDYRHSVCPSEGLALRAQYLVEEAGVSAFKHAFDQVRRHRSAVRLLLSGPWPPYSFVTPPAQSDERVRDDALIKMQS